MGEDSEGWDGKRMASQSGWDEDVIDAERGKGKQITTETMASDVGGIVRGWRWERSGSSTRGDCGPIPEDALPIVTFAQTVVALLSPASTPSAARSELKKLLSARNVRKSIVDDVMNRIFSGDSAMKPSTEVFEAGVFNEEILNGSLSGLSGTAPPEQVEVDVVHVSDILPA